MTDADRDRNRVTNIDIDLTDIDRDTQKGKIGTDRDTYIQLKPKIDRRRQR